MKVVIEKTRITGLPDGEKRTVLRLLILMHYQRVTDRRTNIQADGHTAYSYVAP